MFEGEIRGMFEIQKSGIRTSLGDIGLNVRTHASPKVGQDKVSGGVSILCWYAAPVANIYGNQIIRFSSVKGSKIGVIFYLWGVTVYVHSPEYRVNGGKIFSFCNSRFLRSSNQPIQMKSTVT